MARRHSKLPRNLILLALVVAVSGAAWHFAADPIRAALEARRSAAVAVGGVDPCGFAAPEVLAQMIGRAAVAPRRSAPVEGVPAAGNCTWVFFGGQVVGRAFTTDSLTRGGVDMPLGEYYRSIVTGLEYEFKQAPAAVVGIGDEAVAAGFDGGAPPQLVLRSGDMVLTLEVSGIDRATTEAFVRALLANR